MLIYYSECFPGGKIFGKLSAENWLLICLMMTLITENMPFCLTKLMYDLLFSE